MVGEERFELSIPKGQSVLSASCIPFHHSPINFMVEASGFEPASDAYKASALTY